MAGGKASSRLNTILTQGSSVNSSATSVLDKPAPTEATADSLNVPSANDDPDTSDIEQLLSQRVSPVPQDPISAPQNDQDFEKMLSSVFGQGQGQSGEEDPIAQMMMNMMKQQQQSEGELPANLQDKQYEEQLLKYNTYNQKVLKMRFLIVRYLSILVNFLYHYMNFGGFHGSSYAYIRDQVNFDASYNIRQFFVVFISIEMVILSSYYLISSRRKVTENVSNDNIILKLVSMAAMVVPSVQRYQLLLMNVLNYFEIINIFLGDLSLVVVLFGLSSYLK